MAIRQDQPLLQNIGFACKGEFVTGKRGVGDRRLHVHGVGGHHSQAEPPHLYPAGYIRRLGDSGRQLHLLSRAAQVDVVDALRLQCLEHIAGRIRMERDGDVGLLPQLAKPLQVSLGHGIFEIGNRAKWLQLACQPGGDMGQAELLIRVDAHSIVRPGGLLHQFHGLDDIPRTRLELVVGEPQTRSHRGLGGGLVRLHRTGPVRNRNPSADLLAEKPVQGESVGLTGDIQQSTGKGIRLGEGIQCQRVLPGKGGDALGEQRRRSVGLSESDDALIGVNPAQRQMEEFGTVLGDGGDRRHVQFVQGDLFDLHGELLCIEN